MSNSALLNFYRFYRFFLQELEPQQWKYVDNIEVAISDETILIQNLFLYSPLINFKYLNINIKYIKYKIK